MEPLSPKFRESFVFGIGLLCIFLFIYTGYSKLADHQRFLKGLTHVQLVGRFAAFVSWFVPIAELAAATLMIIPGTFKIGLKAFIVLMVLFTGYIMAVLFWAKRVPCHCGGAIEKLSWTQHIWFNLAFMAMAIVALCLSNSKTNFKKLKT